MTIYTFKTKTVNANLKLIKNQFGWTINYIHTERDRDRESENILNKLCRTTLITVRKHFVKIYNKQKLFINIFK